MSLFSLCHPPDRRSPIIVSCQHNLSLIYKGSWYKLGYEVWICFQGVKFIPFPSFTWATCTHWWNQFGLGLVIAPPKCSENTLYLKKILNIFYTRLSKLFFLNNIMPLEKKNSSFRPWMRGYQPIQYLSTESIKLGSGQLAGRVKRHLLSPNKIAQKRREECSTLRTS